MATPPKNVETANEVSQISPDLPLFRFGLRQFLLFVAGVSLFLAALVSLRGTPALGMLLASLVIAFHLFSTALGSRLRQYANLPRSAADAQESRSSKSCQPHPEAEQSHPQPTPWYGRTAATFAWLPRLIAAAIFIGGFPGALLLTLTTGHRTSPAGLVVGAMSVAALSGWFVFLAGNFYGIVRGGWNEATAGHDRDDAK